MQRNHLLYCLTTSYLIGAICLSFWGTKVWSSSDPNISLAVKGISTEELTTAPSSSPTPPLNPYPRMQGTQASPIQAQQYVLYNPESGKILLQSKTIDPVPIASTTKLMTAHLVSKYGHLSDILTISPESASITGSLMNIHSGERISVENVLYGALLVSGNDAAQALAEYVGGLLLGQPQASSNAKIERFVQEMNQEASRLFMIQTHYKDPVGLNDQGHSSAIDLAKLASLVNEDPILKKFIGTPLVTVYDTSQTYRYDLRNSNRLLTDVQYGGIIGGKTGFTPEAGHCLVTSARRNGITLIAVILHTNYQDNGASAREAQKLLDDGFNLIAWQ